VLAVSNGGFNTQFIEPVLVGLVSIEIEQGKFE
jgi:hypothetical protein